MSDFTITAWRMDGTSRIFSAPTAAQAWQQAMEWSSVREAAVITAARHLLNCIADARQMLEDTDESGATEEAFAALDKALAEAAPESITGSNQ